jgi:RNA polymerase-binding protein DksA
MAMPDDSYGALRQRLEHQKTEMTGRLERITANLRRGYDADSKERAKELEDSEVVDALGNEAREELVKISAALRRMDKGEYGLCVDCGSEIKYGRLEAHPYADECIDCAEFDEHCRAHR